MRFASYIPCLISPCILQYARAWASTHALCTKGNALSAIQTKQKSSVNVYTWICQNWSISIELHINHQTDWIPIHLTIEPNRIGNANFIRSHFYQYLYLHVYCIHNIYISISISISSVPGINLPLRKLVPYPLILKWLSVVFLHR